MAIGSKRNSLRRARHIRRRATRRRTQKGKGKSCSTCAESATGQLEATVAFALSSYGLSSYLRWSVGARLRHPCDTRSRRGSSEVRERPRDWGCRLRRQPGRRVGQPPRPLREKKVMATRTKSTEVDRGGCRPWLPQDPSAATSRATRWTRPSSSRSGPRKAPPLYSKVIRRTSRVKAHDRRPMRRNRRPRPHQRGPPPVPRALAPGRDPRRRPSKPRAYFV
jgi:hypothetical protein